jgi:hypothetical protein
VPYGNGGKRDAYAGERGVIMGDLDDVIVTGGKNVYTAVFRSHPEVASL